MAETIVLDLVGKVVGYLGKLAAAEIASYFGGEDKLSKLKLTMEMIQARVSDAEKRQEGENGALVKTWLKRLKGVLYELEDLFEDVAMVNQVQKKQLEVEGCGKLVKPLCGLVSLPRRLKHNKRVSRGVKAIVQDLERIKSNMAGFNFRVCSSDLQGVSVVSTPDRDTDSYITEESVIGREAEKNDIVEMLLNTNLGGEGNVCVIPIVGMGGLGKTALAQLCYNDSEVRKLFDVKAWVCISDTHNLQTAGGKILKSITGVDCQGMSFAQIGDDLRNAVRDKRYILVLDDVWDDNRERWLQLMSNQLSGGKQGSKILVTTRSYAVAKNMGTVEKPHVLVGLSEEKSWDLFRSLAFEKGQELRCPNLGTIGKEIAKKCGGVPLAIRTIASLLFSIDSQQWESFKDEELRMITQGANEQNDIMATLKISYDHLPSSLKQCFAYCSLFPKDYEFDKEELAWLWMAQGFIPPKNSGHEYFLELKRRCLFQDIIEDEFGNITGCKMHDLLHDMACAVGDECCLIRDGSVTQINDTIRHLRFEWVDSSWKAGSRTSYIKQIRSFLIYDYFGGEKVVNRVWPNLSSLRALDIVELSDETKNFANSVEKLMHLRYLRIQWCEVPLPCSITKLRNLETFVVNFSWGHSLPVLPVEFCKLSSLKHLKMTSQDVRFYYEPMPPRFGELKCLEMLNIFVVEDNNGLDALASMNLSGKLKISYRRRRRNAVPETKAANLKVKKLTSLEFRWKLLADDEPVGDTDEELKWLQPPPTLQELKVEGWPGVRFPSWGMGDFLPKLVYVKIEDCSRCDCLPPLRRLPSLKSLSLLKLDSLEYIDEDWGGEAASSSSSSPVVYFPCLEVLTLKNLLRLKEWRRRNEDENDELARPVFPRLSKVQIDECPKLKSIPMAPRLESLEAWSANGLILQRVEERGVDVDEAATSLFLSSPNLPMSKLDIDGAVEMDTFSVDSFPSLESLNMRHCRDLIKLTAESTSSVRHLKIKDCSRLKEIKGALRYLHFLEVLDIMWCDELDIWEEDDEEDGVRIADTTSILGWLGLKCLRKLSLRNIDDKLEWLPKGIGGLTTLHTLSLDNLSKLRGISGESIAHLTQLHSFYIDNCPELTSLPDSFNNLANLQVLNILRCPKLKALPNSMDQLFQLRELMIWDCPEINSAPPWLHNLTALQKLDINGYREFGREGQ